MDPLEAIDVAQATKLVDEDGHEVALELAPALQPAEIEHLADEVGVPLSRELRTLLERTAGIDGESVAVQPYRLRGAPARYTREAERLPEIVLDLRAVAPSQVEQQILLDLVQRIGVGRDERLDVDLLDRRAPLDLHPVGDLDRGDLLSSRRQ